MDLIFQSGEFYHQESTLTSILKFLLPLLGALISGGIAIWIFNKGIKKRRKEEKEKEERRLDGLREYTLKTLNLLKEPIERQITNYRSLIEDLENPSETINYLTTYDKEINLVRSFSEISFHDLFKIFVSSDSPAKTELFQKVSSHLHHLKKDDKQSFVSLFKYFDSKRESYVEYYNQNILTIQQHIDNWMAIAGSNGKSQDGFLVQLSSLYVSWSNEDNYQERRIAVEKFLKPLQKLCRNHGNDQRAVLFLRHCNACLYAYKNLDALKQFMVERIEGRKKALEDIRKDISSFLNN